MKQKKFTIDILANTMVEPGLSGGNRIFIELAKVWLKRGNEVNIFTSEEGEKICLSHGLKKAGYYPWSLPDFFRRKKLSQLEIFLLYCLGLFRGSFIYLRFLKKQRVKRRVVWSSSDYWPDSWPGILTKLFYHQVTWIGSVFLFAPNPLLGFKEKGDWKLPSLKNLVFYLTQKPVIFLTNKLADFIFVTSQPDRKPFLVQKRRSREVVAIRGGVDVSAANNYFKKGRKVKKEYEACFMGRFHPQKGVVELIDIWAKVCQQIKGAKLVMIGGGELEDRVKKRISQKRLGKNVVLTGFLGDGERKFQIFQKSKIILHPAVYDSGGMAAAEGMAWGLPAVGFDLWALKTYYPRGMLKAKLNDFDDFTRLIIKLLKDERLYNKTSLEARELIIKEWDWTSRAVNLENLLMQEK